MKKNISLSLLILIFVTACGGGDLSINHYDELLTREKAYSKTSNIYVELPKNWFTAEDNECNCTDLWLVNKDYSSSITFKKINIEDSSLMKGEPEKIAEYSKMFVRAKSGNIYNEENFDINDKKFSAYMYLNESRQEVRVVVFKHHDKYYECEAVTKNAKAKDDLVRIQNAVLSTLN
jgi:hypothetical protein